MRRRVAAGVLVLAGALTVVAAPATRNTARNGMLAVSFSPGGGPIWRVDPASGAATVLLADAHADNLSWSPDGRTLVFDEENHAQTDIAVHAVDAAGHRLPLTIHDAYAATFSPDGRRLIFQHCLAFCIATADSVGSHVHDLFRCKCLVYEPRWSPRGDRFAYIRQHDIGGFTHYTIMLRSFSGKEKPLLAEGLPCDGQGNVSWSPDGKTIAFACTVSYHNVSIYLASANATAGHVALRRLVAGDRPTWSPDGTQLAFAPINSDGDPTRVAIIDLRTHRVRRLPLPHSVLTGPYSIAWQPLR